MVEVTAAQQQPAPAGNNAKPVEKPRISCDYPGCDKSFLRSEHLSRHQLNHYGRTLECEQCGKKFARSDLLHRHIDRHRHQQQKLHAASAQSSTIHSPIAKPLSSPYGANPRSLRSLSSDSIPRSIIREQPSLIHTGHYITSQHVQPVLPSPSHGPPTIPLQPCISPMQSIVPGINLPQDYPPIAQPIFPPEMHHSSAANSPLNPSIVIPASPNNAAMFDLNAKWDHLFMGGGIFEMTSISGVESEFGNLTPPDLSLETIASTIPPYQALISAAPTPTLGEFTVSVMAMEKIRHELPEFYRQQRYLSTPNALSILLEKAFFHLHNNYPIFHRPTMQLEHFPTYLILAIASLGALLSDDQETQHFGLTLHNYVRDFIFSPIMFSGNREIWVLQTMLLLNITGNHLGKRIDHEMSDILQGTMITLARRNSFVFEDNGPLVGKRNPTDDTKWQDWVRRESIKRFAHFIFINDTQHSCFYGHQGIMSVWEMKLAMPCSDALWSAPTAQEWRRIMTDERKARAHETHPVTLLDIVTAFVSPNSTVSGIDPRSVPLDGLGLYAVVHGIFSVAWHFRNRKIPHHWANVMQIKIEEQQDGDEDARWLLTALHEWKTRYSMFWASAHYPIGYQPPSPMWSPPFRIAAMAIYDLACIWLQTPICDIQMAAGSRFANGRVISKQRVQQSWLRINKKLIGDDVCHHALNLVEAELLYKNEATGQSGLHSYLTDPSYPLFMPFVAYLGGLALWAYAFGLDRQSSYQLQRSAVALDQNAFHVDSYGMTEYPRLNPSTLSTPSAQHFSNADDYNEVIRTLRGNLALTYGNTGGISPSAPGFFPKSPNTPATGFPHLGDNTNRSSMFKQGIDILLSHLRAQLDGHRWEIAREGFEILQGTVNGRDYH